MDQIKETCSQLTLISALPYCNKSQWNKSPTLNPSQRHPNSSQISCPYPFCLRVLETYYDHQLKWTRIDIWRESSMICFINFLNLIELFGFHNRVCLCYSILTSNPVIKSAGVFVRVPMNWTKHMPAPATESC